MRHGRYRRSPCENPELQRRLLRSALQWLGLQLNLQPATPLRRGRRLAIFIPTDHLLDMPLR